MPCDRKIIEKANLRRVERNKKWKCLHSEAYTLQLCYCLFIYLFVPGTCLDLEAIILFYDSSNSALESQAFRYWAARSRLSTLVCLMILRLTVRARISHSRGIIVVRFCFPQFAYLSLWGLFLSLFLRTAANVRACNFHLSIVIHSSVFWWQLFMHIRFIQQKNVLQLAWSTARPSTVLVCCLAM